LSDNSAQSCFFGATNCGVTRANVTLLGLVQADCGVQEAHLDGRSLQSVEWGQRKAVGAFTVKLPDDLAQVIDSIEAGVRGASDVNCLQSLQYVPISRRQHETMLLPAYCVFSDDCRMGERTIELNPERISARGASDGDKLTAFDGAGAILKESLEHTRRGLKGAYEQTLIVPKSKDLG